MATNIVDPSEVLLELGIVSSASDYERAVVNTAIRMAERSVRRHLHYDPVRRTRTEYYPQGARIGGSWEETWDVTDTQAFVRRESEASTSELYLQHIPVRTITSLHIDYDGRSGAKSGAFAAGSLKTEGVDFWPNYDRHDDGGSKICLDGILRSVGLWPLEPGSIKIVYVAGYTVEEFHGQKDIVDASPILDTIIQEAARRARRVFVLQKSATGFDGGPIVTESLGDYSKTIDESHTKQLVGTDSHLLQESIQVLANFVNYAYSIAG